jgi:hypothetical protein
MTAQRGSLYLNNAHTAITALTIWDAFSGTYAPLAGASVTVRISATPQGAAISGLGPVTCLEAPAGTYSGTFSAAAVTTLTAGDTVYQVVAVGTEAVLSTPMLVRDVRYLP